MLALLAAAPVLVVLVLMVGFGWSAGRAGAVTAGGTLVLAVVAFGFGGTEDPFSTGSGVVGLGAEAAFVALTVVAIIGPALGIHHLQQRTGATAVLQAGLARLTPDPRVAALLIAWFFTLFLEGAAGFGTPVALAAPFLVAAGFAPLAAVTAALVGHAVGVSFGAVGTPVMAQVAATEFTGPELAAATAPYHVALGWVLMAALVIIVGRALPSSSSPWGWGALGAALFFVPFGLIARFVGPELPTLGAAVIGGAAFVGVASVVARRPPALLSGPGRPAPEGGDAPTGGQLLRASAPYVSLIVLVLVTRLVPPIRDALFGVVVDWELFGVFSGSVRPLYHPGLLLPIAFVAGAVAQRVTAADVAHAVGETNRLLAPVVVALLGMVLIARTMSQAGMTDELALAAAGVGGAWPLLAPAVGALGTFVTGSATASNILFTDLQANTADAIDRPQLPLLGAQGFGAAVGNIVCPHNVVAAAATVGLAGQEGAILRRTLPVALLYVALGGLLALWFVR
ncbi:MAG: L-lactate permease [Acidimicrobiales bacterium]